MLQEFPKGEGECVRERTQFRGPPINLDATLSAVFQSERIFKGKIGQAHLVSFVILCEDELQRIIFGDGSYGPVVLAHIWGVVCLEELFLVHPLRFGDDVSQPPDGRNHGPNVFVDFCCKAVAERSGSWLQTVVVFVNLELKEDIELRASIPNIGTFFPIGNT